MKKKYHKMVEDFFQLGLIKPTTKANKKINALACVVLASLFFTTFTSAQTYEAESGTLFNGASLQSCTTCSGGQYVGNMGFPSNGYFTVQASVAQAGIYNLTFTFSSGDPRTIFINANGGTPVQSLCNSGQWGVFTNKTVQITLNAGVNLIQFYNNNDYAPDIDKFELALAPPTGPISSTYEAENASLFNGAAIQNCGSCSGGKYVGNMGGPSNGYFISTVNVAQAGDYNLIFTYSSGDPRTIFIRVNNQPAQSILCNSGTWGVFSTLQITVNLNAGNNTIRFFNENDYAPDIDKFDLQIIGGSFDCDACEVIDFSNNGQIFYNLETGLLNVLVNDEIIIKDAYAEMSANNTIVKSTDYSNRTVSSLAISDGYGTGEKTTINLSGNGLPNMQQIFYAYPNKTYFLTEMILVGDNVQTNYMAPMIADEVSIFANGNNRVLTVPFDNDTFIRYNSKPNANNLDNTSSEVTAFYENDSRKGFVVGSVEQSVWKTGVRTIGSGGILSEMRVWGGYTSLNLTRDKRPHGMVTGANVKSPKIFVGAFEDWRTGLEEYGKATAISNPKYIFDWDNSTPFGWNSWGVIQDDLSLANAKAVVDFVKEELPEFRNENTAFINLDSFWDNLVVGGLEANFAPLTEFVQYCEARGLTPGIYWAPFMDFGKFDRKVEGSTFNYINAWTKVNGGYHLFDDGYAMDPTHPATKDRINLVIDKFKNNGFKMIKIDFIGHASVESDGFFDPTVKTGMQAFHHGMKYLMDRLGDEMLVYTAISPNLATAPYTHMRRIATDAFSSIEDTEYTLNSTNYGWWQTFLYDYIDADHAVFANKTIGENRARFVSSVVTGTLTLGDDFSKAGPWVNNSKVITQNKEILDLAAVDGKAFRPVEGNSESGASEIFIKEINGVYYLGVLNYGPEPKNFNINFNRLGIPNGNHCIKEYFSGKQFTSGNSALQVTIPAKDAQIFEILIGSATCVFSLGHSNFKIQTSNVTCPGSENGTLTITAEDKNYEYIVNIPGMNAFTLPTSNGEYSVNIEGMLPADYEICFEIVGNDTYQQCFEVSIEEPDLIDVSGKLDPSKSKIILELKGSDQYRVDINGIEQTVFNSGIHTFNLKHGKNEIIVKGKQDCQGTFRESITISELVTVSPNPTNGIVNVSVFGNNTVLEAKVYNIQGAMIFNTFANLDKTNNFEIDLSSLQTGIYFLKTSGKGWNETVKIIKQ